MPDCEMPLTTKTPTTEADLRSLATVVDTAFGEVPSGAKLTEDQLATQTRQRAVIEDKHTVAVLDQARDGSGEEIIGGLIAAEFDLSLPGGATVPAAGLAGVGVRPGRIGRGALRTMMSEHLNRCIERGSVASTLWASESGLYGRYGYGTATSLSVQEIPTEAATYATDAPDVGHCDLVFDRAEARKLVTEVYEGLGARRAGTTSRSEQWWEIIFEGSDDWMSPGKQMVLVHWSDDGRPDGFAFYKVSTPHGGDSWIANGVVKVREFAGYDVAVERSMLSFLKNVPLCRTIRFELTPVRQRLSHQLRDPRQLRQVEAHDGLWLRPLNIKALLEARSYQSDGEVNFEIDDEQVASQRGPWRLAVTDGVAKVEALESSDQVSLSIKPQHLGSVLLGDTRISELVQGGVLATSTDSEASIRVLDRLMTTTETPFTFSRF